MSITPSTPDAPAYTITVAGLADVPALVVLVNSAYRGEEGQKGWTEESHLLSGSRTNAAGMEELLREPQSVILKYIDRQGIIAGCVYLQKQGDKLYLGLLSVSPSQQNTGIGKQLLAAAAAYAAQQHCTAIHITVISLRHELLAWYERHGYRRTGEIEPFHAGEKFGIQKQSLELVVLEKPIPLLS